MEGIGIEVVGLELSGVEVDNTKEIEIGQVDYREILKKAGNFISLDISVKGTGWVKGVSGEITEGRYTLSSEENKYRRREYREFLKELAGDVEYDIIVIEQTIMGNNYKTTEILIQLNTIMEDLVLDGDVKAKEVVRVGNKEWKRGLRELSGYKPKILKEDDKKTVRESLKKLGYNIKETKTKKEALEKQDIHDAYGIILGYVYNEIMGQGRSSLRSLKTDINRGYIIRQYKTLGALKKAGEGEIKRHKGTVVEEMDLRGSRQDIQQDFKEKIQETGDDSKVYLIAADTLKGGLLVLDKGLDVSGPELYILAKRRKSRG